MMSAEEKDNCITQLIRISNLLDPQRRISTENNEVTGSLTGTRVKERTKLGLSKMTTTPAILVMTLTLITSVTRSAQAQEATPTPAPVQSQDSGHALGLKEAVDLAIEHYPELLKYDEAVHQQEAQIPVTRALVLPNLSAIGTGAEKKDAATNLNATNQGNPYNAYTADLHLTQPIAAYGFTSAIASAKKDLEVSKLNVEVNARNLASTVIQAYYQVVLDMRNVDTYKRQERIENEALITAEKRAKTGRGQVLDVLQVKTQIALLKSQIAQAENQLEIDAATLSSDLGNKEAREVHVKDRLEAPELAVVDRVVDLKNFRLPELEINKVQIAQIDDQKAISLGTNLPYLGLTADYMYGANAAADVFDGINHSWDAMITLTIPIFSGFSMKYQQEVLNSQQQQLNWERQNIELTTNLNQISNRKRLETAEQNIIEGREALRLAIASSDEARRMYQYATIDFLQLLTVEQSYVQAESSFNGYKYSYLAALANYFVSSGQNLDRLVELLERSNR